jgi:hypothetical protein
VHSFEYDGNGNTIKQTKDPNNNNIEKKFAWYSDNSMNAVYEQGVLQHYIYDGSGERAFKASGTEGLIAQNGQPTFNGIQMGNYTTYASGYVVVSPTHRLSKHYYAGSERVASKLAGEYNGNVEFGEIPPVISSRMINLSSDQQANLISLIGKFQLDVVNFAYPDESNLDPEKCDLGTGNFHEDQQCDCQLNSNCQNLIYYYHTDHLGSTNIITDYEGEVS